MPRQQSSSPFGNLSDEELLARVQQIRSALPSRPEEPVAAPPPTNQQPYLQAERLEQEARPPVPATGWRGIGEAALRGLAATGHPGGFHGYNLEQQQLERQRQQDLLGRAQQLRGEGMQRDRMNLEADREQRLLESSNAQLEETRRLRQIQEGDAALRGEIANRPQFKEFGTATGGTRYGQVDPRTAQFTQQGEIPGAGTTRNPGFRDVERDGRVFRQYFDQADPSRTTYEVDTGAIPPRGLQSEPGSYMDLRNEAGQVIGAWNPKSGEFKPVPAEGQGLRRTGLPPAAVQTLNAFDAVENIINDIEKYSKRIHTSEGLTARAGGLARRVGGYAGYDADITSLQSKAGEISQLIRALGESGALATGDVDRGLGLVPTKPEYTATEAAQLINDLRTLIRTNKANVERRYGIGGTTPTNPTTPNRNAQSDPLGIR